MTHCLCSAAAVGYSRARDSDWKELAKAILAGAYEATILAAYENSIRNPNEAGSRKVFLTFVGGGVFGNRSSWIEQAIVDACEKYKFLDLDVYLVSYGHVDPWINNMIASFNE